MWRSTLLSSSVVPVSPRPWVGRGHPACENQQLRSALASDESV